MAAIASTTCRLSPTTHRHLLLRHTNSNLHLNSSKPFFAHIPKLTYTSTIAGDLSRSCLSHAKATAPKLAISALGIGNSETDPDDSNEEVVIDLNLPRRSLLVQFTCNLCGERTERLVNRLAYERGLIYVQCSGCLKHHKLIDNLGLVVEYDLRDEINSDRKGDELYVTQGEFVFRQIRNCQNRRYINMGVFVKIEKDLKRKGTYVTSTTRIRRR